MLNHIKRNLMTKFILLCCHHKYISVQKSYAIIIHSQLLDERWSFLLSFKYYLKLDTLPYNVDNWMTFHFIVLLSNYLRTFKIEPFYHRVKTFNHCRFTKFCSSTFKLFCYKLYTIDNIWRRFQTHYSS